MKKSEVPVIDLHSDLLSYLSHSSERSPKILSLVAPINSLLKEMSNYRRLRFSVKPGEILLKTGASKSKHGCN